MKTEKTIPVTLIFVALMLLIPMLASAMGNSEQPYGQALEEEFINIAEALDNGDIDLAEARDLLHEFRADYGRSDNEDYQEMERLLTMVQTREMTILQTRERLNQLEECQDQEQIQLKDQEKLQDRTQDQTKLMEKEEDPDQTQDQDRTQDRDGSGTGSQAQSAGGNGSSKK